MRGKALFCALLMLGCGSSVKVVRYTPDTLPPTDRVEVLTSEPTRDYSAIAELSVKEGDDAILELAEKAKAIGANAIILIGQRSGGAVAVPIGNMVYAVPVNRVVAIAIKYR